MERLALSFLPFQQVNFALSLDLSKGVIMAIWTSVGHAMRRRMGAPSNHHESAGKTMARNIPTTEEILASAEHANSARRYVGMDVAKSVEAVKPERGTLIGKKNKQASDPTAGGKANRKNNLVNSSSASERMGARYSIKAKFAPTVAPEAAPTMANAKVVPSVAGKQSPNFEGGIQGSM